MLPYPIRRNPATSEHRDQPERCYDDACCRVRKLADSALPPRRQIPYLFRPAAAFPNVEDYVESLKFLGAL